MSRSPQIASFDGTAFLRDQFGNAENVVRLLTSYRLVAPTRDTARKWFERGAVPSEWLPLLACVLELENGAPPTFTQYVQTKEISLV